MYRLTQLFILAALFSCSIDVAGQKPSKKSVEQQKRVLLSEIVADIPKLKLALNRTYAHANVASVFWEFDRKLSYIELHKSFDEFFLAQIEHEEYLEKHKLISGGQNSRKNLLHLIGDLDAKLSLTFLHKTRNKRLKNLMKTDIMSPNPLKDSDNSPIYRQLFQSEIQLEQRLLHKAAIQNPDGAVELLKRALKYAPTLDSIDLLKRLHQFDPLVANMAAATSLTRLLSNKYLLSGENAYNNFHVSLSFVEEYIRPGSPKDKLVFEESKIRILAKRVLNYSKSRLTGGGIGRGTSARMFRIEKRFFPETAKKLSARDQQSRYGESISRRKKIKELFESGQSIQDILAASKEFSPFNQRLIIPRLSNKILQNGNRKGAIKLLKTYFSGTALTEQIGALRWNIVNIAIENADFDTALTYVNKMHENSRFGLLIKLAEAAYIKNPAKNKQYALHLLKGLESDSRTQPRDSLDFDQTLFLVRGHLKIESDRAFELFEPLIPRLNEIASALKTVSSFRNDGHARNCEFLLSGPTNWGFRFSDFAQTGKLFVKQDFKRTLRLINKFKHPEIRIKLKLILAKRAFE